MEKVAQNTVEVTLEPYVLFDLKIAGSGISNIWIANNLEIHPSYVSKIRRGEVALTEKIRQKMNELLETDY